MYRCKVCKPLILNKSSGRFKLLREIDQTVIRTKLTERERERERCIQSTERDRQIYFWRIPTPQVDLCPAPTLYKFVNDFQNNHFKTTAFSNNKCWAKLQVDLVVTSEMRFAVYSAVCGLIWALDKLLYSEDPVCNDTTSWRKLSLTKSYSYTKLTKVYHFGRNLDHFRCCCNMYKSREWCRGVGERWLCNPRVSCLIPTPAT